MRPPWIRTAAAMAVILAACSPSPKSVDGIADRSVSPTTATLESRFPVGREWREQVGLESLTELVGRVNNEQQRRIGACMKARGFDYVVAPYIDSEAELARLQNPLNDAIAKEYGYHLPLLPATVPQTSPNEAFATALQGDGTSNDPGCVGSPAVTHLRDVSKPSFDLYAQLMFSLDQVTDTKFFASADFEQLSATWSKCMAAAGYEYDRWFGPLSEYSGHPSATNEEIGVRLQDLSCDRQVALTESRSNIERADFEHWMSDQELQIGHLLDLVAEASKAVGRLESEQL